MAEIVAPREIMIPMNLEWGRRAVIQLPKLDPDSKVLEDEYPGIHAAMWSAVEGELRGYLEAELPVLWSRLEEIYLTDLRPEEIRGVLTFYRTPTGQRLIRAMYTNADLQPMIESMASSDDGRVSQESMREVHSAAKVKAVTEANIDEGDIRPLMKVISLDRMRSVGQKVQQSTMAWVNEEDPKSQARIDERMLKAAEQFMTNHESQSK